jgi:hypothetical protein
MAISKIAELVGGSRSFRTYSGLVLADRNRIYALTWHEPTSSPFGVKLDQCCHICDVDNAWEREKIVYELVPGMAEVGAIVLECRSCGAKLKKEKPPGVTRLQRGETLADYRVGYTMIQELYRVNRPGEGVDN